MFNRHGVVYKSQFPHHHISGLISVKWLYISWLLLRCLWGWSIPNNNGHQVFWQFPMKIIINCQNAKTTKNVLFLYILYPSDSLKILNFPWKVLENLVWFSWLRFSSEWRQLIKQFWQSDMFKHLNTCLTVREIKPIFREVEK